jgi:hypothetical protein
MPEWTEEYKNRIVRALIDRGAHMPCPRCGNKGFTLLDGYFAQPVQTELGSIALGGPTIPSIVMVCTQCGFISQHALGALGLLPKEDESND